MHKGVGLIIGNESKDLFFIQKKDETYPIKKWVNAFSFWGGKIEEEDNSPLEALLRELEEELSFPFDYKQIQFVNEFLVKSDENYQFHLFELLLPDGVLQSLNQQKVNEGHGALATKESLLTQPWIWGLEQVVCYYFKLV